MSICHATSLQGVALERLSLGTSDAALILCENPQQKKNESRTFLLRRNVFCSDKKRINLNMADVTNPEEEIKQDEPEASVSSEIDETSQETPNGVKT